MPLSGVLSRRTPTLMAGRLRHTISIVIPNGGAQDSTGGFSKSEGLVVFANVPASIDALSGTEKFAAHEFVSQVTHQVTIRYIGAAPSWLKLTPYFGKALIVDSNSNLQQAQGTGTSGSTAPIWATTLSATTTDAGVTWKNLGPTPLATVVSSAMQVVFQGRVFQIESVLNPDERNKALVLMCIEINDSRQQTITFSQPDVSQPDGGGDMNVVHVSTNYTAVANDFVLVNSSSGPVTITIPLSSGNANKTISVKKISSDSNTVTLARSGSDLLEFDTSITFDDKGVAVDLISDGISSWVLK